MLADSTAALASGSHLQWVASFPFFGCSLEPALVPLYVSCQGLWHRQGAAQGDGGNGGVASVPQAEGKAAGQAASVQLGQSQECLPTHIQGEASCTLPVPATGSSTMQLNK